MVIIYSHLIGDLFTYGHLQMLERARQHADQQFCGVITDRIASQWTSPLIGSFEERKAVIEGLRSVDRVMEQDSLDPTENLQRLHSEFPDAKLLLMQSHHMGQDVPGAEYIRSIGGEVVRGEFYRSLGRDYIRDRFLEYFQSRGNIQGSTSTLGSIGLFRTKADTLKALSKHLQRLRIERLLVFTVTDWVTSQAEQIRQIQEQFPTGAIVVRSSSLNEDAKESSNAGRYSSVLGVDPHSESAIRTAVDTVVQSYQAAGDVHRENQILVQQQTENVRISGVVFTRNLWSNTPYYLINYDDLTGQTDTVTSGVSGKKLEILRSLKSEQLEEPWRTLIQAIREVEEFFKGTTLDIEFAILRDGQVVLFQVRPLAANARFHSLHDDALLLQIERAQDKYLRQRGIQGEPQLVLSDMAFWNPAELIGDRPAPLDRSLFEHLIAHSTWNEALIPLGYTEVKSPLLLTLAAKPYVVVNRAFRCLLPNAIPERLKDRLVAYYLRQLREHPEWHDKIEFKLVHNCYTFDFPEQARSLEAAGFSKQDILQLRGALLALTNDLLHRFSSLVIQDTRDIKQLMANHSQHHAQLSAVQTLPEKLQLLIRVIDDCRTLGTPQFTRMARLAFISSSFLKSLEGLGLLSADDRQSYLNSISTVATELEQDLRAVRQGVLTPEAFLKVYGHLRPGTYDVMRPSYRQNPGYLDFSLHTNEVPDTTQAMQLGLEERIRVLLDRMCAEHMLTSSGTEILFLIRKSTELREWFKFVYTRNICTALDLVESIAQMVGIGKEDAALLDIHSLTNHHQSLNEDELRDLWHDLIRSRKKDQEQQRLVSLPPLVFAESDFECVPSYLSQPNFISEASVEAECVLVSTGEESLQGKIAVLEKADPGFDWIFGRGIVGLVTKYGGAASHMAIRCAEFSLPAAIGVGDLLFIRALQATKIHIHCKRKELRFL